MRAVDAVAWLECTATGCAAGMAVDARHVDNLTAGGWRCHDHAREVTG